MELNLKFKDDNFGTSIQKINTILVLLSEGKFKDTFHLIQSIQNQVQEQINPKEEKSQEVDPEEVVKLNVL